MHQSIHRSINRFVAKSFIAYAYDLFNHNQDELVMSNRLEISRSWGLSKYDGVRGEARETYFVSESWQSC